MSFCWEDYLSQAQWLISASTLSTLTEANFRSAISRAYYAAFCTARKYLSEVEQIDIPTDGSAHSAVRNALKGCREADIRLLSNKLNSLRIRRNDADYLDTFSSDLSRTTQAVLQEAELVLVTLNRHSAP